MLYIFQTQENVSSIFSFAVFISALALLSIVYTITDIRFKFRIAIAPIPLQKITYGLITLIGLITLLTDLWFAKHWPIPAYLNDQLIWQSACGGIFLGLFLIWIYYAFINPPIFNRINYKKYSEVFLHNMLKGSDNELSILVNELSRSASSIIKFSKKMQLRVGSENDSSVKKNKPTAGDYAYDFLLLIGNRKICHYVMGYSSITAIAFFQAMKDQKKFEVPITAFAKNITRAAIINDDSILYHEDYGYNSGLFGYIKPFSQAIYGNFTLVEALAKNNGSPLDIDSEILRSMSLSQFEAYCRCVRITFESYIVQGRWPERSYALFRAFLKIQDACFPNETTDVSDRLFIAVHFIRDLIDFMDKIQPPLSSKLKLKKNDEKNFYDHIADLMFEIIFTSSSITIDLSLEKSWSLQYGTVWSQFFSFHRKSYSWKIINYKLRRQLYDSIRDLSLYPNYKSAKILGFFLSVRGLILGEKDNYANDFPLHKATLNWIKNNYLTLRIKNKDVAEACLINGVIFDAQTNCLVKTYLKGLNAEPVRAYLQL